MEWEFINMSYRMIEGGKMKKKIKKIKSLKGGFSSLELVVVIGIIGILIMVSLPQIEAYSRSVTISESKHNYHTIVYCIREWSLGNDDNRIVPGNFTVQNSQGNSVIDYLREYNIEYYNKNLRDLVEPTLPITPIYEVNAGDVVYTLQNGILSVDIPSSMEHSMRYNSLVTIPAAEQTKYIKDTCLSLP